MQWLIDLIAERVIATIGIPPTYIDRGDPAVLDLDTFTCDGSWHELDLSAIIPAGAKAVLLRLTIRDDAVGSYLRFRKTGSANAINRSIIRTQVSMVYKNADMVVALDDNRKIEYSSAAGTTFVSSDLAVGGWWL